MDLLRQTFLFILGGLILHYLPAEVLLSFGKVTLRGWRRMSVGYVIGIVLLTVVGYVAAWTSVRFMVLPLFIGLSLFALYLYPKWSLYLWSSWKESHVFLLFLSFLFSLSVVTSGWSTPSGLTVSGINNQDGIWNIALIQELKESFPPQHPAIAGVPLRGYHILYNFWLAEFIRILPLDIIHLHFHFVPIVLSILFVYGVYQLSYRLGGSKDVALWSAFFSVLGGSFAFIVPLVFHQSISIDDGLGINQPISLLVSPSFISSLICLLYAFILLDEYMRKASMSLAIGIVLLAGLSVGFKVYAGMLVLPALLAVGALIFLRQRRWDIVLIALMSIFVSMWIFFPLNANYGFLRYQPFWPPHRVMQGPLDFTRWELKRQTLEQLGSVRGLWKLEAIALFIFVFGNIGSRIIGVFGMSRVHIQKVSFLVWALFFASVVSFLLPMFFLQPIGAFNMIQFYWYFIIFTSIFAGWGIARWLGRLPGRVRVAVAVIIILLTIPSAIEKLRGTLSGKTALIDQGELVLYRKLASLGTYASVVLEIPDLPDYSSKTITSWFWRSSPPKISALGAKRVFLGGEVVQFPYEEWIPERIELLSQFFSPHDTAVPVSSARSNALSALRKLQEEYNIHFIVTTVSRPWFTDESWARLIFSNEYGAIYEVLPV